jgi:arginine deiminase
MTTSSTPTLHVDSEVGALKQVVVHRPGVELTRLTPSNVDELLFDDVMWAARAREEHDSFVSKLRDKGVVVHQFAALLAEVLGTDDGREFVLSRTTNEHTVGPQLVEPLRELLESLDGAHLAEALVGGVLKHDLSLPAGSSLLWDYLDDEDFVLAPLPNTLFQRDNVAFAYAGLSVHPMAKPARERELVHSRAVLNFHPLFRDAGIHRYYGDDDVWHHPATCAGGDILVAGNGVVLIGMGPRTTPQGVGMLVGGYFSDPAKQVTKVIVVELPKNPPLTHLDTALTMLDATTFSVYPYLDKGLTSYTLTPKGDGGSYGIEENTDLFRAVSDALGVGEVRVLQAPIDEMAAAREQWDDGSNFLAVAPGVVFGYDRNQSTNTFLRRNGIEVVTVTGSELGRGHGGPRAMTCPIERGPAS